MTLETKVLIGYAVGLLLIAVFLYLYYKLMVKPFQNEKQISKDKAQAEKDRKEITDSLFNIYPTSGKMFDERFNGSEGEWDVYQSLNDTK